MNLREPFLYHKAGLTLLSAKISSLPSTRPVVEQIFRNYENATLAKMFNSDLQLYLRERAIFQEQNLL